MTITELLQKIGDDNIVFQNVNNDLVEANTSQRNGSTITVETSPERVALLSRRPRRTWGCCSGSQKTSCQKS